MTTALSLLLLAQLVALATVLTRLARGRHRLPWVKPRLAGEVQTTVSVVVPARNEASRIGPCLDGLHAQGVELVEVIVVDGSSTDATPAMVDGASAIDPRIRRIAEPPRPPGAVGRPWAIAAGCRAARGEWVLILDADTTPRPGMVAGAVDAARSRGLDAVSFAPRIVAQGAGAQWLQPAFLTTLVYRFGPPGLPSSDPARVMANGQCQLVRRSTLLEHGGYEVVASSYCDDVAIARHLAAHGARVGFLDAPDLLDVMMYPTARETWRAWPPSLVMRGITSRRARLADVLVLVLAQALPVPVLALLALFHDLLAPSGLLYGALIAVNVILLALRFALAAASWHSFSRHGIAFWLSPFADLPAVARLIEVMLRRPREWRGRFDE